METMMTPQAARQHASHYMSHQDTDGYSDTDFVYFALQAMEAFMTGEMTVDDLTPFCDLDCS